MGFYCASCSKQLDFSPDFRIGRRESCPFCAADLHSCQNCSFFDKNAYNHCRETQADRVLDKKTSNFCDYFSLADRNKPAKSVAADIKSEALKKLDDLFK
jgi:hypothetical protein